MQVAIAYSFIVPEGVTGWSPDSNSENRDTNSFQPEYHEFSSSKSYCAYFHRLSCDAHRGKRGSKTALEILS